MRSKEWGGRKSADQTESYTFLPSHATQLSRNPTFAFPLIKQDQKRPPSLDGGKGKKASRQSGSRNGVNRLSRDKRDRQQEAKKSKGGRIKRECEKYGDASSETDREG